MPPGYFTSMATVISMDKDYQIAFDEELFRNKISFRFGSPGQEIDKLTITLVCQSDASPLNSIQGSTFGSSYTRYIYILIYTVKPLIKDISNKGHNRITSE